MPLYEYRCKCGKGYDRFIPACERKDQPCPACNTPNDPAPVAPAISRERKTEGKGWNHL